jgi:hypothetical protein
MLPVLKHGFFARGFPSSDLMNRLPMSQVQAGCALDWRHSAQKQSLRLFLEDFGAISLPKIAKIV